MNLSKPIILITMLSFLFFNCSRKEDKFIIEGVAKGIKNNTSILLMNANSIPVDSTIIHNEKFTFSGQVNEPTQFFLLIKSTMDFQSIWIENDNIIFNAETKSFREAKISGSKTQDIQNLLNENLNITNKEFESTNSKVMERHYKYPDSIFNDSIQSKYILGERKTNNVLKEFVKEHPNNIVSAKTLNDNKTIFGKKITFELYAKMNKETKNSKFGKSINEYIKLSASFKFGDKFIDFEQENTNGKSLKFSDFLGEKYTLLEFWASWCGPCRRSNPKLVEHYNKYKSNGFEVFGVSLDTEKENWLKAIKKDGLPWQNVSDLKGYQNEVALTYNIAGLPNSILLDEKGVIIAIGLRDTELKNKLEGLFNY